MLILHCRYSEVYRPETAAESSWRAIHSPEFRPVRARCRDEAATETWAELALYSIDLQLMDLGSVPNPDQQTKTSTSECLFAVSSSWRKGGKSRGRIVSTAYLNRREPFLGFPSSPRTTSHIGVENMRQIRSSVRNVMGFPASTFCQYRTEYPCESMSSWLSPASSRRRLIRAPKPLKNRDSSRMIPFFLNCTP